MDNNMQPLDSLVDEIKGTTGYLSNIFSARLNLVFAIVVLGAILAITILN